MSDKTYILIVTLFLITISEHVMAGQDANLPDYDEYFGHALARTASGEFIPAEKLGSSEYCGLCHTQIYQQWNASSHHFSSFNNPIYRKVAQAVEEKSGRDTLKFCASCHDPLPLFSGELDTIDDNSWSATAGITCLACHRITEIHGKNGNYVLEEPILHPFALADNPILQNLHGTLINLSPWLHTQVLSKPFYSTPEFCSTCHTLEVPESINKTRDIVLLNEYENWKNSQFSKIHSPESLTTHDTGSSTNKAGYRNCLDCHMPLEPSTDPAATNGMAKSHRFAASHTALPTFNRDNKQLENVEAFLSDGKVDVTISRVVAEPYGQSTESQSVQLSVNVKNKGVGHTFPAGTIDSNEAWLQISVVDASGVRLFSSGSIDSLGMISDDAERFGAVYFDRQGKATHRGSTTTEAVMLGSKRLIDPGEDIEIIYQFETNENTKYPITVDAKLNWRKYAPQFIQWVFDGRTVPTLPVTNMSRDTRRITKEELIIQNI